MYEWKNKTVQEYENETFSHQNVKHKGNWTVTIVWYEGMQTFALLNGEKVEVFPYVTDLLESDDESEEPQERVLCWIDEQREPIVLENEDFDIADY